MSTETRSGRCCYYYLGHFFCRQEIVQSDGHERNAKRGELLANFRILVDKADEIDKSKHRLLVDVFIASATLSAIGLVVVQQFGKEDAQLAFGQIGVAASIENFQT